MKTKVQLSFMMFVEWFIWGAWFVPLWLWLSKSGFTAGEIGWSYACTAIAAILSPILVGSLTDRFFAAQKVLSVLMFAGVDSICQCNTPFNYLFRCFELQCLSRSVV